MKRAIIILIPLFLLTLVPVAFGAEAVGAEYPYGAADTPAPSPNYRINIVHPSASASTSAIFFTFQPNYDGGELTAFQIQLIKIGSPVGYLCSNLYAITGTYGSTATPTGASLERSIISLDVAMASVQAAGAYVWFNFSGTTALTAGVTYALTVEEVNETSADTSNAATAHLDAVGSSPGNCGYYQSGGWTSGGASVDACFVVWQEGGDAVTYLGNNIIYGDTTVNVTSSGQINASGDINATGAVTAGDITSNGAVTAAGDVTVSGAITNNFNNTAVTAGDVTAGAVTAGDVQADGAVTVSGAITNNFNNTAVTASGDITAGAVTATGDVTANGAITLGGDLSVNGTFDNATMTMVSSAITMDTDVWAIIFIALMVGLIIFPKVPLMNFLMGIVGIAFTGYLATNDTLWTNTPYLLVVLGFVSLFCILRGGFSFWRDQ